MRILNILVVEDEAPKRKHIESFIKSHNSGDSFEITRAESVSSALDIIDTSLPDLIILDMSLPTYEISDQESGGRPQGFGGLEVLRYLKMSEFEVPTLVITGYEAFMRENGVVELSEIADELFSEFGGLLEDVLYFSSAYSEWKDKTTKILNKLGIF